MLCQSCQTREANVHIRETINGATTEKFLCQECADAQGEMQKFANPFSFPQFLTGMLGGSAVQSAPKQQETECPTCGLTMHRFSETGKFGCPDCYTTFNRQIPQIIKNFQGGYFQHQGKNSSGVSAEKDVGPLIEKGSFQKDDPLAKLKAELQQVIEVENFEKAAELRDQIKAMEEKGGE